MSHDMFSPSVGHEWERKLKLNKMGIIGGRKKVKGKRSPHSSIFAYGCPPGF